MAEYLVRHSESEANVRGVFAGQRDDSPLTERGRRQAKEVAAKLKSYRISKIVTSPLRRTTETTRIIAAELDGLGIIFDDRLAEYDMGDLTGTPIRPIDGQQLMLTANAEDPMHFARRVCECFIEHTQNEGNTLFVGHGGTYKIIKTLLDGKDLAGFCMLSAPPNSEIIEIDTEALGEKAKNLS